MHKPLTVRRSWLLVVAAALVITQARDARAQGFVSPFIGYNFGGDAGCPGITTCKDKHANYGVAFGALGSVVGFEAEIAHTNDFFGSVSDQSSNVLTFMSNFMIAPKFGPIQPYGLAGAGWIRTSVETPGQRSDDNEVGWDAGGGLIGYFTSHIGVRGDVRYFHSFQVLNLAGLPSLPNLPFGETKIDFGRFSIAAMFKF
jgi:opacity protein-like surface antigen